MSREEIQDLAKRYGGKATTSPSGKTSFVVVGEDPGAGKIEKAKQLKLSLLKEEQFYKLIQTMPRRSDDGHVIDAESKSPKKEPSHLPLAFQHQEPLKSGPSPSKSSIPSR